MRIAKSLWVFTTHKETIRRSTDEFIIDLFYHVDLVMGHQPKHVQATLSPSERVTLALLVALKGGGPGAFAPLAAPHLCDLVSGLAGAHPAVSARCCAPGLGRVRFGPPTVLGVADSYGIEVRHPWRTDRADRQIGGTTLSNHRWIVGAKLADLVNHYGQIVAWEYASAEVGDQRVSRVDPRRRARHGGLHRHGLSCEAR